MRTRALVGAVASTLVAAVLLSPTAAEARGGVSVRNDQGKAEADTTYSTTITVSGSGFQSIKNAHGGIYVAFGTVSGTWRPSQGGVTGANYRYVPDSEAKGNKGFLRYVAFPGSDTASSANGGTLKNGGFTTTLTIPGPKFQTYDRNNKVTTVDCLAVQCGVITFGAHGVKNANNETFTPVKFTKLAGTADAAAPAAAPDAATDTVAEDSTPAAKGKKGKKVKPAITVDRRTAVQGRVLAFTAVGFTPGEQVVAILDDGVAAAGPIVVGTSGEIAAVIQIPATTEAGTHTLRLSGPSSGTEVEQNFPISGSTTPVAETVSADDEAAATWLPWAAASAAGVLLLLSIAFAVIRTRRLRRTVGTSHAS